MIICVHRTNVKQNLVVFFRALCRRGGFTCSSLLVQVLCFVGRTTNNFFLVNIDFKLYLLWNDINKLCGSFCHYINLIFKVV